MLYCIFRAFMHVEIIEFRGNVFFKLLQRSKSNDIAFYITFFKSIIGSLSRYEIMRTASAETTVCFTSRSRKGRIR